ncbi:MAG: transposase [Nitrososphaerota archaeon]|nr:transposase [Nitrososphaerota archaeon]
MSVSVKNTKKSSLWTVSDAYLKEIATHFNCTVSAIYYAMVKHKLTRKKTFHLPRKIP